MRRKKLRIVRLVAAIILLSVVIGAGFFALKLLTPKDTPLSQSTDIERRKVFALIERQPVLVELENYMESSEKGTVDYSERKKEAIDRINEFRINQEYNIYKAQDKRKVAYLTFDDGPSAKATLKILDILDHYQIKATFFVMGQSADTYPESLKEVYKRGHKIANHTYSHDYRYLYSNIDNLIADAIKCNETLKKILGDDFENHAFRFPGGCFGNAKRGMRKVLLEKLNFVSYNWNCLNGDAEGKIFSKEHLVKRFKETKGGQDKLIILMHDTDAKYTTPEALPEIIDILKAEGYSFAVLPD